MKRLRKMIGGYLGERGGTIALRTLLVVFSILLVVSFVGFGGQDESGILSLNFKNDNFTLIAPQFAGAQTGSVAPYAPSGLSATAASQTQINLSWTDNATNETGYRVYRNTVNVSGDLANSTVSYSDYSLACGTSYSYYVQAYNSYGSSNSGTVSQSTVVCTPSSPTGVTATAASQTQINISWSAVSGATSYKVYRGASLVGSPTGTSYSDAGLSAGTSYTYYVQACNVGGCSGSSTAAAATTDAATPGTPTIGTTVAASQTTASVSWSRISPFTESGFEIRGSSAGGGGDTLFGSAGAGATSATISGLGAGTSYTIYVRAYVTTNGRTYYSGNSGTASITTDAPTPSAPTIGSCSVTGQTTATVTWTDTSSNETGFVIYDSGSTQRGTAGAGATSGTASGLTANTSYQFNVKSYVTTNGRTYYSSASANTASCTTLPNAPSTPTGFTATGVSTSQVNLSWSGVSGATSYTVKRGSTTIYNGVSTSYSDAGLSCSTSYSYTVYASNSGGDSGTASASDATTLCTPGLDSPPNVTWTTSRNFCAWVTGVSGTQARAVFVWTPGPNYGSYVSGYGLSCYTHTTDVSGLSWYAYASDGVNPTSENSASRTANIDATAPSPNPPTVSASAASQTSVSASMSTGSDGGSGLGPGLNAPYGYSTDGSSYTWYGTPSQTLASLSCGTTYTVYGKISDVAGNMTSAGTASVTTNACNTAPTANNVTCSANEGSTCTLTASASDANGDVLSYSWYSGSSCVTSIGSGSTWNAGTQNEPTTASYSYKASDGSLSSGCATATATWNNVAPTISVSNNAPIECGSGFETWTATPSDPGGSSFTYQWYGDACVTAIAGATGSTYSTTISYGFSAVRYAKVSDAQGLASSCSAASTASSCNDTTVPSPNPPTVSASAASQTSLSVSMSTGSDNGSGLNTTAYGYSTDNVSYIWYGTASQTLASLSCGTTYTVYGKIRDVAGNMTSAGTAIASTTVCSPAAPSGLSTSTVSQTQINLSWTDTSSNETGFNVYRGGSLIAALSANSTSFSDTGLSCGTSYSYYIVAYNVGGDSANSNTASGTTASCVIAPTSAPESTTTADPGRPQATVSTPTVTSDGYYVVRCSANTTGCVKVCEGTGSGSCTVTVFSCPTLYKLYRYAYNVDTTVVGRDASCNDMDTKIKDNEPTADTSYLNQKKCSPSTVQNLNIEYCTRGFLLD